MVTRRDFLQSWAPAVGSLAFLNPGKSAAWRGLPATSTPEADAQDEDLWFEVQRAFTVDRSMINLNNGGVCPSPADVQNALARYLSYSNEAPAYTMWRVLEPQKETVRKRLAQHFGSSTEEIAMVRNASEGLQICQLGFDLEAGDEVLTTTHDYGRMITTFKQRERRDGIVLKQFSLPIPADDDDEVVRLFESNITEKTKVILMCHIVNITGQILPVKKVVQMARKRGIPVIVDGAHAFAHFTFDHDDLDCDYYASSLHKWLFAPFGTGLLYVRKEKIESLWPLMAAPDKLDGDIRKFEEIGTHPCPNILAIAEALSFHEGIGPERKEARMVYLRNRWAERVKDLPKVSLHTSLAPRKACGIATVGIDGIDPVDLADHLWKEHRIFTVGIRHEEFNGIRVTPSVYTTVEEIDRFGDVLEGIARKGSLS
ncbi:MAG: aminotransferase class V-fold PLP-dependent enzyme [Acidobacteriota bacterium]